MSFNSYSASRDTGTLLNRIIKAQWEGMGGVGSASTSWHYFPPCLTIRVLSYSNCQRSIHSIDAQWEGMGDVGSARYFPPCPTIRVLSYSN